MVKGRSEAKAATTPEPEKYWLKLKKYLEIEVTTEGRDTPYFASRDNIWGGRVFYILTNPCKALELTIFFCFLNLQFNPSLTRQNSHRGIINTPGGFGKVYSGKIFSSLTARFR